MPGHAPRLLALSESSNRADSAECLERLCRLARPGTVAVVLRDPALDLRRRLAMGRRLVASVRQSGQRLVVGDRIDLARALDADGVHLPAAGVPPRAARRLVGRGWVSRAGHGWRDLDDQDWTALDALLISPVLAPRKGRAPLGFDGLQSEIQEMGERSGRTSAPLVYALGGVDERSARACIDAGATGVAAIGAVHDPHSQVALLRSLDVLR